MDLILWRHAEAQDGFPDEARVLTPKGMRQAERMAAWLAPKIEGARLLTSPAARAVGTAAALSPRAEVLPSLSPGASVRVILAAAGWPGANGAAVVVGHQPDLGLAASFLLTGREAPLGIKKGAIWWFQSRPSRDGWTALLRAVVSPDLLEFPLPPNPRQPPPRRR
ncbi:MAG: SixA phosphatase family protein [Acidobacteriota bacterium]